MALMIQSFPKGSGDSKYKRSYLTETNQSFTSGVAKTITFSDNKITTSCAYNVYTSLFGMKIDSVVPSTGTCAVTLTSPATGTYDVVLEIATITT